MRKQTDKMVLLFGIVMLFLTAFMLASPLSFAEGNGPGLKVVYFYENVCDSCDPEGEFIELFNRLVGDVKKDVDVELLMYNTFHDSGFRLIQKYFEDDKVPEEKQIAPILFLGDKYLEGSKEIEERFRDEFIDAKATIPALGCIGDGETVQSAIDDVYEVGKEWLRIAQEEGRAVPKPELSRDELVYSGKFTVRVPKTLHKQLVMQASSEGISLNQLINDYIAMGLGHKMA